MRLMLTLVASLVACCTQATAADWYTSLYGGGNWNNVIDAPFVEAQPGLVIGGTVGRNLAVPGLRIEADLSYRHNEVELFGGAINADHDTTGLMMNAVYDLGAGPVKPYLLVGIGYAHSEAVFESVSILKLEASDVAFQAGVGLNAPLFPGARIGVGFRVFKGPAIEVLGTELSDGVNKSVVGSLSFDL